VYVWNWSLSIDIVTVCLSHGTVCNFLNINLIYISVTNINDTNLKTKSRTTPPFQQK